MGWRVCPGFQTVPSSNDVGCTDFCAKPSGWNIGLDTYTRHSKMVGKENWKKGQHFLFLFLSYRQQNHMPAWDTSYFSEFMSVFEKHYLVQDLKKKKLSLKVRCTFGLGIVIQSLVSDRATSGKKKKLFVNFFLNCEERVSSHCTRENNH